jgi:hypothetical protein
MATVIKNVRTERWQQTCLCFIINSDMKTYTITVDYAWSCQEKSFDFVNIIIMDCDACMSRNRNRNRITGNSTICAKYPTTRRN